MKKLLYSLPLLPVLVILLLLIDNRTSLLPYRKCSVARAEASQLSDPISDWQVYSDDAFNIAFEYPAEWEIKSTIEQTYPYVDASAILKRLTLIGKEGLMDLDIWSLNNYDFASWIEWYEKTRSPFPETTLDAKIADSKAIAFLEDGKTVDLLTVFWSDNNSVYRLWYTVTQNQIGLDVYYHILESISLSGSKATSLEIPDETEQKALKAVEESGLVSPLTSSCCGKYSPGNPFPCCDNKGNCTWWVFYKYGYVPFRGDAGTWWSQVPNYPDWARGGIPKKYQENIVWWSGSPGHVAYAANYTGGSNITISEMLWCTSCGRTSTIAITSRNFIYEKYPPQP